MKKLLLVFGVCAMTGMVQAGSFKLVDPTHPQIVTGVFTDLKGHSDAGVSLALVTHSDWCPLAVGGSLGRALGGPSLAIGTSVNLLPAAQGIAGVLLTSLYPDPVKFQNLKTIFTPPATGTPDISMSFGPHWSYVFTSGLKGKGVVTWFIGAQWGF